MSTAQAGPKPLPRRTPGRQLVVELAIAGDLVAEDRRREIIAASLPQIAMAHQPTDAQLYRTIARVRGDLEARAQRMEELDARIGFDPS